MTGFYWVLLGFTGFYRVAIGIEGFHGVLPVVWLEWVPSFRVVLWVLLGSMGFYRIDLAFTGFFLPDFMRFYRV